MEVIDSSIQLTNLSNTNFANFVYFWKTRSQIFREELPLLGNTNDNLLLFVFTAFYKMRITFI